MRKFFEKFGLLMQIVLSFIFVLFIILLLTGVLDSVDFHNNVVYILFGTLIALELVFSAILLYLNYTADMLSYITISNGQATGVKASISVIRKTVKEAVAGNSGIRIINTRVSIDERGLILHLRLSLKERNPEQTIEPLRLIISKAFMERVGLEFCYINFILTSVKFKEKEVVKIEDAAAEIEASKPAEAPVVEEAVVTKDGFDDSVDLTTEPVTVEPEEDIEDENVVSLEESAAADAEELERILSNDEQESLSESAETSPIYTIEDSDKD